LYFLKKRESKGVKFKKLKPIAGKDMDMLWQEYILIDAKTRKSIEIIFEILYI
jgi:hypothetical protein